MNLRFFSTAALAGMLTLSACQPIQPKVSPSAASKESAGEMSAPTTIQFAFKAGEDALSCGQEVAGLGTTATTMLLNDLRFYVSNIRLLNEAGEEVPLSLNQDGLWQYQNTVLLDFEDASAGCAESGNAEMNSIVTGLAPEGDYKGVIFQLGVPFELNHQDVAVASSPLNVPAMWWNWRGGYKFVRVDMMSKGDTPAPWFIHLGSTGCKADEMTSAPAAACARPNVAEIRLDDFNPATNTIVADLATLLTNVNLNESMPEPPGCMSGPDDPDCGGLLPGFGLEIATGACAEAGCPAQSFFRVE